MNFEELTLARYSLRKFSSQPVEEEKLMKILEAGRVAPTAHNLQPQRVFVIQKPEDLAKADACLNCHYPAPCLIVVGYNEEESWHRETDGKIHGEIDAAIVATSMMFQATDIGLGTVYIGMFEPEKLIEAFPVMAGTKFTAVLALGYPAEGAHPAKLHINKKALEETTTIL